MLSSATPFPLHHPHPNQHTALDFAARKKIADANVAREAAKYGQRIAQQQKQFHEHKSTSSSYHAGLSGPKAVPQGQQVHCPSSATYGHGVNGSALFKRSVTPTQFTVPGTGDAKTAQGVNIGPQADRPLLNDFFADIQGWARKWTALTYEQESNGVASIRRLFSTATASPEVLDHKPHREQLVAGIVAYRVMVYTLSDEALVYCNHEMAGDIIAVLDALDASDSSPTSDQNDTSSFTNTNTNHQHLLQLQKELYTRIQSTAQFHAWRESAARDLAAITVTKLHGLLTGTTDPTTSLSNDHDDHHHQHHRHTHLPHYANLVTTLTQLFIRGFRISFRMRTTTPPSQWRIHWITRETPFCLDTMVNTAHHLHGNCIARTVERITACPGNYRVRWGVSPVVVKVEGESEVVVHKGMVCLEQVGNWIGVEAEVRRMGSSSSMGSWK